MSTRSQIAVYNPTCREYTSVYCHFDGYPEGVGRQLLNDYNSTARALGLVDAGAMFQPGQPYTGERARPATHHHGDVDFGDHMQRAWADYAYRWHYTDEKWQVSRDGRIWADLTDLV